ncbi:MULTISPECIES: GumC family protein [unclassified Candidatus Frackibacter]|uniref:GumC family protein n=1 Tax=unclassified Candidatus Frackibacter TaxID=2648818 RepID=UPI00088CE28D|nr:MULTISPECIES: Wzz/FepE/Etk N-terminal domain-containing protein [unclassified Candidatus Frackibacter]SDC08279.1 polysaccharide chain length determinant protein, PEP-CTERM locus subfamily [Candidatus Frackibacter sp. WG11]SEM38378.1 polysaccharide chain length determinant protein, PEP-CTERM locus subfamily [Candidatus Frackibacter sp. WG12]SFL43987.1 polysaccharide chain length determinant protein, PEP-CTERM locus subfamily [Candidatus Frackibacter sp. WG13]
MERLEDEMIEIDLREYFNIIWRQKWLIIGICILAVVISYVVSMQMQRVYQTSTLVMIKEDQGVQNLFDEKLSLLTGQTDKVATYTQLLKSRRIIEKVIKELDLREEETGELIEPKALRDRISIAGNAEDNLINITVNYPDPVTAKKIANTLVAKFKEVNQRINQTDLQGAADFITKQLATVKEQLANAEDKLLAYKEKRGVVLPTEQAKVTLDKLTELETLAAKTDVELKEYQAGLQEVKRSLTGQNKEIVSTKTITKNPIVENYQTKLAELKVRLASQKEIYTDRHPKIIALKRQIDEVQQRLKAAVKEVIGARTKTINPLYQSLQGKVIDLQTKIITVQAKQGLYKEQIDKLDEQLSSLPKKELQLTRLERKSRVTERIYTMLMEKNEEVQIQKAMQTSDLVVIDSAIVKGIPIKPNIKLNIVIATFLAVFVGIGLVFVLEYFDDTVKSEEDIERLTGLPVLGTIPDLEQIDHTRGYGRGGDIE